MLTRRVSVKVRGIVQGVGFRPFVYQLAARYGLTGWVRNTSEGVQIEIEGDAGNVDLFLKALALQAPPRAVIEHISTKQVREKQSRYCKFEIKHSQTREGKYQLISPDIATCPDCLKEIFDPRDRRYRYPFTNCTNCGPRFTIIEDMPYDRTKTTMRQFKMCPECQSEYEDPLNRRFHAQPNACPKCGPKLRLVDAAGRSLAVEDVISAASELLREGRILAIKGLGGFLLACDATNETTVALLRQRKHRPSKPLAIMAASIEEASDYCYVNSAEAELLSSPSNPIVLLERKHATTIASSVAPGLAHLGVMLPYTPLHHLLLRETGLPLIMTSGNLSEEPIASENDEALARLSAFTDYFILHNREICSRYDDSVVAVDESGEQIVRRARGYAPYPIRLNFKSEQVLACGPELKNTFCLTRDQYAFISQHIGDLENLETMEHFEKTIGLYERLFRVRPAIVAHDLHPDYLATKYAKGFAEISQEVKLIPVQHHFAHIVSCMVDNGITSPVIGVAFDGTGYGTDGCIWGGEFLIADYHGFKRAAHLEYLPLPGGDLAVRKPCRTAYGYTLSLLGEEAAKEIGFLTRLDPVEAGIIGQQVRQGINAPITSSCGRLFDAVAAIIGVRQEADYEAQAAVELEAMAMISPDDTGTYSLALAPDTEGYQIELRGLFYEVIRDVENRVPTPVIAVRFHNSLARMILQTCQAISDQTSIREVALSGGVFQNRLLLRRTVRLLESNKFCVFTHRQVPCNDGGISLGQAVIANFAAN